jgi:putative colanic acid biosynthesis acetyltransferase WcaF
VNLSRFSSQDFDRGASRVKEALWVATKCVFFLPPWPMFSAVRVALLRLFGATVGHGVVIRSKVNITFPWRLTIGDHVWLGEDAMILNLAPVTIESSVCVSQRAFLCTGSHDYRRKDFALIVKPISLRTGSWVAAQAFVGPGVELGSGAVLSAGSVAVENIPARSLARGNPATVVKQLDPPA